MLLWTGILKTLAKTQVGILIALILGLVCLTREPLGTSNRSDKHHKSGLRAPFP